MSKVELKVIDPQKYDRGVTEEPVLMTYVGTENPVVIDTETAFIECDEQGKSAAINRWMADFDAHKMKLTEDAGDGNYKEIDYVLATGVVGQLIKEIGVGTLQTMLKTINSVYGASLPSSQGDNLELSEPTQSEQPNNDNIDSKQ